MILLDILMKIINSKGFGLEPCSISDRARLFDLKLLKETYVKIAGQKPKPASLL